MPLSLSISGVSSDPREAIVRSAALMASLGQPRIHLDAMPAGLRPRELDRSARRDVASMLKRAGVSATGIDLFLPPRHLAEAAHVDRAVGAIASAIELLAELASLGVLETRVLCLTLPPKPLISALQAIESAAVERGVAIADFSWPPASDVPGWIGRGVDCGQAVAAGRDAAELIASSAPAAIVLPIWNADQGTATRAGRGASGAEGPSVRLIAAAANVAAPRAPVVLDARGAGDSWKAWVQDAAKAWREAAPSV